MSDRKISYIETDDEIAWFEKASGITGEGLIQLIRPSRVIYGKPIVMDSEPIIQSHLSFPRTVVTELTSAAGYTLTAAELLGGLVTDATNTGAIAVVMPTVAATVASINGWVPNLSFYFIYRNTGDQTVTLGTDALTQWTMTGTMTIATLNAKLFLCIIDSATTGRVYSIGTFVC